jgi:hypothetical protein
MPKSVADHSLEWSHLLASVGTNSGDVPFLDDLTLELNRILRTLNELDKEQLALIARKQQITRDREALKNLGRVVAARIRSGLRTQYGFGSEKLTEFGMRPRRRSVKDRQAEQAALDKLDSEPVS